MTRTRLLRCESLTYSQIPLDMRIIGLLLGFMVCAGVSAQGKALHDSACLQCHSSLSGGDPYQLYQRPDRKVKTLSALSQRVKNCALAADVSWSNSQREAVVQYLQDSFYHF